MIELWLSLLLSVCTISICGIFKTCSALVYDDFYEIPFYITIKIQFDMIFGWLTLHKIFGVILNSSVDDFGKVETKERQIRKIFDWTTAVFWVLLLS